MLPSIQSLKIDGSRILLRADLNVPIKDKAIIQDYRLKAILPTIDHILARNGKVILIGHIGRPHPQVFDENYSTKIIAQWLSDHGYQADHEIDLMNAVTKSHQQRDRILVVENLRFFQGERAVNDHFADLLSQLGDFYINDAFGCLHRTDTSVTLLAEKFSSEKRACGLLVEKEISQLSDLFEKAQHPFVMVLGGSKIDDKISTIKNFITQEADHRVTTILVGGLLAQAFLQAQTPGMRNTEIDDHSVNKARIILDLAEQYSVDVILPSDFLIIESDLGVRPTSCSADALPTGSRCVDIGPTTVKDFCKHIAQSKTIFMNGTMGIYEYPVYASGTQQILQAIASEQIHSVIGGGDAVAAAFQSGYAEKVTFLSTGGGATLAFLAAHNPYRTLPGLKALCCDEGNALDALERHS